MFEETIINRGERDKSKMLKNIIKKLNKKKGCRISMILQENNIFKIYKLEKEHRREQEDKDKVAYFKIINNLKWSSSSQHLIKIFIMSNKTDLKQNKSPGQVQFKEGRITQISIVVQTRKKTHNQHKSS